MREIPYSWQILAENVSDPSHVPWSHHGVIGNRTKAPRTVFEAVARHGAKGFDVFGPWTHREDTNTIVRQAVQVAQVPTTHDIGGQRCSAPLTYACARSLCCRGMHTHPAVAAACTCTLR